MPWPGKLQESARRALPSECLFAASSKNRPATATPGKLKIRGRELPTVHGTSHEQRGTIYPLRHFLSILYQLFSSTNPCTTPLHPYSASELLSLPNPFPACSPPTLSIPPPLTLSQTRALTPTVVWRYLPPLPKLQTGLKQGLSRHLIDGAIHNPCATVFLPEIINNVFTSGTQAAAEFRGLSEPVV